MSSKQTKTPQPDRSPDRGGPDHTGPDGTGRELGAPATEVELAMDELLADVNGEIVLFNDSALRRLAITTDAAVVGDGRVGAHRTATGQDVSGFRFLTFDDGVRLYYEADLDVVVRRTRSV